MAAAEAAPTQFQHPWSTGKCLVLFTAKWCGHCKAFQSTWQSVAKQLKASAPTIRVIKVDVDRYDVASVQPQVFGFPTVRAYSHGTYVSEFDADRTTTELHKFATAHLQAPTAPRRASQKAGTTASRRRHHRRRSASTTRRQQRRQQKQRGGAHCGSAMGKPFDVPSKVPAGEQWSGPYDQAPASPYNGGLYTGPPASGPHAPIPVTPTAANYIHNNLRSASGTPQSTTQYPTAATHRPGNSWSAMPGVYNYAKQGTGPHRILCTGDAPAAAATQTGGRRRRRATATRRRRRQSRQRGGLQLRAPNLDDGAPFHPEWATQAQAGGRAAGNKKTHGRKGGQPRRRRRRGGGSGLRLRAPNMDDGAPFHPEWA